jgi:hypothetical protein
MSNNPDHMDNLKPFQSGHDERRNLKGRPKKFLTVLKELGYANAEINETFIGLLGCSMDELNEMEQDEKTTMLVKVCIEVLKKSFRQGSFYNIDMMLTRAFGKPKETVDTNVTGIPSGPTIVQVIHTGVPLATSEKEAQELYK